MAKDAEALLREVAVETYRGLAAKLHIQASVCQAQAEALEDAAAKIEAGEADVDTLRLVPTPYDHERDGAEEESPASRWMTRRGRLLDAVVAVSYLPVAQAEQATLLRLAERAGFEPGEADEWKPLMEELVTVGLVERVQFVAPGPRAMQVFVPTGAGYEEARSEPPPGTATELRTANVIGNLAEAEVHEDEDEDVAAQVGDH
jgi:hypothetical protein